MSSLAIRDAHERREMPRPDAVNDGRCSKISILPPEASQEVTQDLSLWCARQLDLPRAWANCRAMGVFDDRELVATAIFHGWQPEAGVIEISAAAISPRWLTREVLHELFAYPFDRLEYQMVVLRVSASRGEDRGICRMARAFGFEEYRIPRLRGRNEDEFIFTLTEEDWRSSRFNRRLQQ